MRGISQSPGFNFFLMLFGYVTENATIYSKLSLQHKIIRARQPPVLTVEASRVSMSETANKIEVGP